MAQSSSIHYLFDNDCHTSTNGDFGVIKFQLPHNDSQRTSLHKDVHFIISCDRSGSMQSHMRTLRHLLRNIVIHLKTNTTPLDNTGAPCNLYITIIFFDHEVNVMYEHKNINEIDIDVFIRDLNLFHSRGMTNFQKTLEKVSEVSRHDNTNIHIFMTDGEITDGSTDVATLLNGLTSSTYGESDVRHSWVGFGTNHQVELMKTLTSQTKGNYFFVDKLEYAGLVYGEILSKELNRAATDITFTIEVYDSDNHISTTHTPLLYDSQKNEWSNSINIQQCEYDENIFVHCKIPYSYRNITHINVSFTNNSGNIVSRYVSGVDTTHMSSSSSTMNKYIEPFTLRQEVLDVTHTVLHNFNTMNTEEKNAVIALLENTETQCNTWLETPYTCNDDDPIQMNFIVMVNQLCDDIKMAKLHTRTMRRYSQSSLSYTDSYQNDTSVYLGMRHISQTQQRGYTPGQDLINNAIAIDNDNTNDNPFDGMGGGMGGGYASVCTPPTIPRMFQADSQMFSFAADPDCVVTPPRSSSRIASFNVNHQDILSSPSQLPPLLGRNLSAYTTPLRSQAMEQTQGDLI